MRKWIALISALLLVTGAACGESISLRWTIGPEGQTEEGTALLSRQVEGWVLTSSWLEEYAVLLDFLPDDQEEGKNSRSWLPTGSEALQVEEALVNAWHTWLTGHTAEKRNGMFSGDAFDRATEEQAWEISWSDVAVMLRQIQKEDSGSKSWVEDLIQLAEERAIKGHSRLKYRLYDGKSRFSLTLEENGKVLGTLSGNLEKAGSIFLVAGWAEAGKDYYAELRVIPESQGLRWESRLLADDACAGYRTLTRKNAEVFTWNGSVRSAETSLSVDTELTPDNGTGPFFLDLAAEKDEIRISASVETRDQQVASLTMRKRNGMESDRANHQQLIRLNQMSAEDSSRISGMLSGRITRMLLRLVQLLPSEMMNVILQ